MRTCNKCGAEEKPGGVILHRPECPITESQLYIDTGERLDPRCQRLHEVTVVHVRDCNCLLRPKDDG